jgi:hypothetical protein
MPDIVPHLGRYCEVATRNGRLFGELVRLSAVSFLVRSRWRSIAAPQTVEASEITRSSTCRILTCSVTHYFSH